MTLQSFRSAGHRPERASRPFHHFSDGVLAVTHSSIQPGVCPMLNSQQPRLRVGAYSCPRLEQACRVSRHFSSREILPLPWRKMAEARIPAGKKASGARGKQSEARIGNWHDSRWFSLVGTMCCHVYNVALSAGRPLVSPTLWTARSRASFARPHWPEIRPRKGTNDR